MESWGGRPTSLYPHKAHSEKVEVLTIEGRRKVGTKEELSEDKNWHKEAKMFPSQKNSQRAEAQTGLAGVTSPSWPRMTWAMVMPPISESLKRRRNVPSGSLRRRLVTYCLLMKPMISLARMKERMGVEVLDGKRELEVQLLTPPAAETHRSDQ